MAIHLALAQRGKLIRALRPEPNQTPTTSGVGLNVEFNTTCNSGGPPSTCWSTSKKGLAWRNRILSDFGLVKKSASPIIMMVNSDTANRMKVGGRLARPPKHQI
ncbi:hypothetical protein RRG08_017467 [Elysia crispata]|uniref:Uncharacterized protein n=1 Tax=Elysia crispata TaxID=231223 RepID=A0AAE1CZ52_9GAST|nr:hypothetical protein RRG08_017467 [Elysia crispata]